MYIVTFFSSAYLLHLSQKGKYKRIRKLCLVIAILLPSILAGVRDYEIGTDVLLYGNYWFEKAVDYSSFIDYIKKAVEYSIGPGYAAVNYISSRVSPSPHFFYFFYELIQLVLLYYALKPYKNKINISYAFLAYYFLNYNNSLNILRQSMAIIIVLFAFQYVINRKPLKFFVAVVVAATFHTTALVALPIYLIDWALRCQLRRVFKYLIILGSLLIIFGFNYIVRTLISFNVISAVRYEHYLTDADVGGRFIRIGYWAVLLTLVMWRRKALSSYFLQARIIIMCTLLSFLFSAVTLIGSALMIRIAYYYDIIQIITLPLLQKKLNIKINKKNRSGIILILLPILYWLIVYIVRNGGATYPYMFMKS